MFTELESTKESLTLRPIEEEDLPQCAAWRNDPLMLSRTREYRYLTMVDQRRWYERITAAHRTDHMFMIDVGNRSVGVVGLCYHNAINQTAEVSFFVGYPQAQRKGVATAALTLLHNYGFHDLNLNRIWAEVFSFNTASVALLSKLGYQEEGRLRQHVYKNGTFHDSIMMGILRTEWKS